MRIGVDLGGSKIELLALDDQGVETKRFRQPTPQGDYDATIQTIADMVHRTESDLGLSCSVGIATPGAISPASGLMKNSNSTCLNDRPLQRDLETALNRPLRLANDADCFALSEASDGAAAGAGSVFGVIVGTGTGAGIVIDGKLLSGPNAIAGEWGHNPLPWPRDDERPGAPCYCGQSGCIETWLSGPGMAANHERQTAESLTSEQIIAAARAGSPGSVHSLNDYVDRMARALASVINLLDPEVIVLGGGMSNIDELYFRVPDQWQRYVFSDRVDTRLVKNRHGDSSGVRGAAWLWPGMNHAA
ncbi:MAG: ROK family protein [Gammaproteobacteria bacterium]